MPSMRNPNRLRDALTILKWALVIAILTTICVLQVLRLER